jgi:uncharacterized protein YbaR (Trm112 family)
LQKDPIHLQKDLPNFKLQKNPIHLQKDLNFIAERYFPIFLPSQIEEKFCQKPKRVFPIIKGMPISLPTVQISLTNDPIQKR